MDDGNEYGGYWIEEYEWNIDDALHPGFQITRQVWRVRSRRHGYLLKDKLASETEAKRWVDEKSKSNA